ncbi:MAG TPA: adenosine deaminase, partial [Streptosporangiaceae bacterium]
DDGLAGLARMSVRGSAAPEEVKARLIAGIDAWLAAPDPSAGIPPAIRPGADGAAPADQPATPQP